MTETRTEKPWRGCRRCNAYWFHSDSRVVDGRCPGCDEKLEPVTADQIGRRIAAAALRIRAAAGRLESTQD